MVCLVPKYRKYIGLKNFLKSERVLCCRESSCKKATLSRGYIIYLLPVIYARVRGSLACTPRALPRNEFWLNLVAQAVTYSIGWNTWQSTTRIKYRGLYIMDLCTCVAYLAVLVSQCHSRHMHAHVHDNKRKHRICQWSTSVYMSHVKQWICHGSKLAIYIFIRACK